MSLLVSSLRSARANCVLFGSSLRCGESYCGRQLVVMNILMLKLNEVIVPICC